LKIDLMQQNILNINPQIAIIPVSVRQNEGLSVLADWLINRFNN